MIEKLVSTGVYILSPEAFHEIPSGEFPITSLFENLLIGKKPLGVFEISEDWIDIGHFEHLKKAREGI